MKSPQEIIATWPEWKRELAGHKERKTMKKSLIEIITSQFKEAMKNRGMSQTELGVKMGITPANISKFLSRNENLTIKTLEKIASAIGGEIEIRFIPSKTELELLREENERLKKQLSARRYVESGTLNKR